MTDQRVDDTSRWATEFVFDARRQRRRNVWQEASTEQHLIVRSGKWSEAKITIIKDCARGITLLKLWLLTDTNIVQLLCNSRATCNKQHYWLTLPRSLWSVVFVCHSVSSRITEKVMSWFHWNLVLWLPQVTTTSMWNSWRTWVPQLTPGCPNFSPESWLHIPSRRSGERPRW